MNAAGEGTTLSRAEKLLLWTTAAGLLHHVDHVLRFDHSGWPFRAEVTTFTYSLVVYLLVVAVFLIRERPWIRVGLVAVAFLAPTLLHVFAETPAHQFRTWAYRPEVNLPGIRSPLVGGLAATLSVALSGLGLWALIAFVKEARDGG